MSYVTLVRTLSGLAAADDNATAILKKWPVGESLRANVTRPRAGKSLRRWWVLCKIVSDNSEQFKTPEQVSNYLKVRSGHATPIVSKTTGEVFLLPDSISYDALDETAFKDVWQRVVQVVSEEILGTNPDEIELEIQRICGLAR